mmetsp:Transcript_70287/g.218496  ORF Transcript_70287/g.218496 Transcript_70287/m.218496 type:complete len:290 (-) Transcript_70287:4-873(-)
MSRLDLAALACDVDGLLGAIAQFADAAALCSLEAAAAGVRGAFARASASPSEAPWRVAVAQRGLRVDLEAGGSGEDVHRLLKRFYSTLRGVSSPANWQWPVQGREGLERLERAVQGFARECEGCPGRRHLLEFAFKPAAVRAAASGDAAVGPPPAPALSNQYHGCFHGPLGIRTLHLEVSAQAVLTRRGGVEQALFLQLRLGRPVPESAWVRVVLWCGERASEDDCRGTLESGEPDVRGRMRLPSGCASVSVARVAEGSRLHAALASHGTVRLLLAFDRCGAVEPQAGL